MTIYTPISTGSGTALAAASAALTGLDQLSSRFDEVLKSLPQAHPALLDALDSGDSDALQSQVDTLLQRIDDFWLTPDAQSLTVALEQALRYEMTLKIHEGHLDPQYGACLPAAEPSPDAPVAVFGLHVQLEDTQTAEIAGALVMCHGLGPTLLWLPGVGLLGFASRSAMSEAIAHWLNDRNLQGTLLNNVEQRYQDTLNAVNDDPELFLPPFEATDVQLQAITGNPFRYSLERQAGKQRQDVRHACVAQPDDTAGRRETRINRALRMRGLFGPIAVLELRELAYIESLQRKQLPHWFKYASSNDQQTCQQRLQDYDQTRSLLLNAMDGAASPEQFADIRLRARLATDLGYDLDPQALIVSTTRSLPQSGEPYTVSHSLLELALRGLHQQDHNSGSVFQTQTTLTLDQAPVATEYPLLTPAYIARLVEELNLRVSFGDFQRQAYGKASKQQLVSDLLGKQVTALAFTARIQGHISEEDFLIVEGVSGQPHDPALKVQLIKLNDLHTPGKLLVFRKSAAPGRDERLVLFAADAPREQRFKGFANETQLLHELVGWSASQTMSDYLVQQVSVADQAQLQAQMAALRVKPYPPENFLRLLTAADYTQALQALVAGQLRLAIDQQAIHTPHWYVQARAEQRQELLALEEAAQAAGEHYRSQPHTQVQEFEAYVHQRASQKISQLLGLAEGQVDPDRIIITSERETLSYTRMLRDGYDDSLGLISASAESMATFSGPEGVDLSPLTPEKVARSVRGKWLADDYIAKIRATLLDSHSTGYAYRRRTSLQINQLQMQAAALRSLLKGHISAPQYQWLRASVDRMHLNDRQTREDYPLFPLQLHIDKPFIGSGLSGVNQLVIPSPLLIHIETVQGCFIVLPTRIRQAALLYTPSAPDGIEFRLFASFVDSLKQPGMIDYYKDRCRVTARKTLSFFLNDMKKGGANKPPFVPREWFNDLEEICFNRPLERRLRDVEETTTGRHDMLSSMIWTGIELVAAAVTLPFPVASFAVGAFLAFQGSIGAVKALANSNSEAVSAYILMSVLNSVGAIGDLHAGLKGFAGLVHKLKPVNGRPQALTPVRHATPKDRRIDLCPMILGGQGFWRGKVRADGYAPLLRSASDSSTELHATGRFARRDANGNWRAVGHEASPTAPEPIKVSLSDARPADAAHARGIFIVDNTPCIELGGQTYHVQFDARLRIWNIVDPANPYAFFGRKPVHLDAQGKWQLSEPLRLRGGMDKYGQLPPERVRSQDTTITRLNDYQLPEDMHAHALDIVSNRPHLDPLLAEFFADFYADIRKKYATLREKLYNDAKVYFAAPVAIQRPALPHLRPEADFEELIQACFTQTNGLVIGEAPKSIASKRLLIENMVALAKQDVKVLYIEHLFTDQHLKKLAKYRNLAGSSRAGSHELKEHFAALNHGALSNASSQFDYYHLVKAAHRNGIEVRPFSSNVSYPHSQHPVPTAAGDKAAAQKMSNFFGHKQIAGGVQAHPEQRWVALLDQKLANTCNDVPGISELNGAISLRVQGEPGSARPLIRPDIEGTQVGDETIRSDFSLDMSGSAPVGKAPEIVMLPASDSDLDYALSQYLKGHFSGNPYPGPHGFSWSDIDGWQRIDPQHWSTDSTPTPLQLSLMDADYEIPTVHGETLHDLANFQKRGLDQDYHLRADKQQVVKDLFIAKRAALKKDALQVVTRERPPRPTLPEVPPGISPADFLVSLYQHTDGVIIGESFGSVASKKLVIDNLPTLSQQQVKTLYLERLLSDLHQVDLDRFADTGHMSKRLLHDLKRLDRLYDSDPAGVYTFEQMVIKARDNNVDICAIDCAGAHYLQGLRDPSPTIRQQMLNHFADRKITRHQEIMGAHKWIALVDNTHTNTYKQIVPGIAELQGGIGMRVVDVKPGAGNTVKVDTGELLGGPSGLNQRFVRADFRATLEILQAQTQSPQVINIERRLNRPGMFLIEQGADGQHRVVHRSRDLAIYHTPVQHDTQGRIYVERARWTSLNGKPFADLNELITGLKRAGLTHAG